MAPKWLTVARNEYRIHTSRIRRIRRDVDHVRLGRLNLANDRREIDRGRRIGFVIDDLEPRRFGVGHGHTVFRELVSVPLILNGPGIEPGVESGPVRNLDLGPT